MKTNIAKLACGLALLGLSAFTAFAAPPLAITNQPVSAVVTVRPTGQ